MSTIAVVIPAYQAAASIGSALASVAAQTRPADEVVVVDDGSTDDTAEVARRWSACLPLTVVRLDQNIGSGLGAGGARARGIAASTSETIALLDADDFWLPDHLDVMSAEFARGPGFVTGNYLLWAPGRTLGTTPAAELVPVPPPEEQHAAILSENYVFISSMFSRSLYDEVGGFRNIRCEDWDLWIRMIRSGARVTMPSMVTVLYRQDVGSVSGTDKLLVGDVDLLTELLESCDGADRLIVEQALRRRHAKQLYLAGIEHAEDGDISRARRAWVGALRADPSLRGNRSQLNGRVAIRAAVGLVAPRWAARTRASRQRDTERMVGNHPAAPVGPR